MKRMACVTVVGLSLLVAPLPAAGAEPHTIPLNGLGQGQIRQNAPSSEARLAVHGNGGTDSCGSWTQGRAEACKDDTIHMSTQAASDRLMRESWVYGFITAINWSILPSDRGVVRDLAEDTDNRGLFAYIDNYCAVHPLETVYVAATDLTNELLAKWLAAHPARK